MYNSINSVMRNMDCTAIYNISRAVVGCDEGYTLTKNGEVIAFLSEEDITLLVLQHKFQVGA